MTSAVDLFPESGEGRRGVHLLSFFPQTHLKGLMAAIRNENIPNEMKLAIQEFAGRKTRKQLFYFIMHVGFELQGFELFLL